ncbi:hypothetical protein SAMN05444005_102268 [Flavobacterium urocaniciphilum]|uniref:Uncharacterized protein n=1 Tax=Flavobacterium urocaniciphilum TaxID=1299341 RepID=A0A1H9APR7_9FLAO|nr:hypothetical protein SAMN05444005_102268 [Flavobacterium urocaniciphilum]
MKKFKIKVTKIAVNFESSTAKDLIHYSKIINQIQIKNSIHFNINLNSLL